MKLTQEDLRQIIVEELERFLLEEAAILGPDRSQIYYFMDEEKSRTELKVEEQLVQPDHDCIGQNDHIVVIELDNHLLSQLDRNSAIIEKLFVALEKVPKGSRGPYLRFMCDSKLGEALRTRKRASRISRQTATRQAKRSIGENNKEE